MKKKYQTLKKAHDEDLFSEDCAFSTLNDAEKHIEQMIQTTHWDTWCIDITYVKK